MALATGEEIGADVVVGGVDPKRLLLGLVDPETLGPQLGWQAGNLRLGERITAKVNLALAELPRFAGLDADAGRDRLRGRILVAPDVGYLDRAADAAKYGRISAEPWLEATPSSLVDPLLVDGAGRSGARHVMSVLLQSAPYRLREGDWDARREELGDLAIRTLETVAPGIGGLVVDPDRHQAAEVDEPTGWPACSVGERSSCPRSADVTSPHGPGAPATRDRPAPRQILPIDAGADGPPPSCCDGG